MYAFADVTKAFCKLNGITAILRSHEMRQEGYTEEHDGLCKSPNALMRFASEACLCSQRLPTHAPCPSPGVTIFSAPRYCGVGDNKGAFARIDAQGTMRFTRYEAVPPQGVKPMAYAKNLGGML